MAFTTLIGFIASTNISDTTICIGKIVLDKDRFRLGQRLGCVAFRLITFNIERATTSTTTSTHPYVVARNTTFFLHLSVGYGVELDFAHSAWTSIIISADERLLPVLGMLAR